jgi:DNA-binding LytR/AlgR family response regulator
MQPIQSIIIDDEPLARKGLKEYISDVEFLSLAGEFEHPLKAATVLSQGNVQLIFLDIQMPKLSGIDFFKTLSNAPPVIFTTAYPQYALEGFELNALDYLVKPVSFDRFYKAALRAKEYYEVREGNRPSTGNTLAEDHFFIKSDNKLVKIFFDEILFAEALQNYVTIHTKAKKYISYLTFRSLEEYLPADRFIRTHKSFIVAATKVESIDGYSLKVGDHQVPISRNLRDEVMEKLLGGKFLKR